MSVASDALIQAVAGLGGSIFSTLLVHPIDFVKMRMQLPGAKYSGMLSAFREVIAEEGFLQLYTGLGSELIKSSTQNFIYIYVYSFLKEIASELQTKRYERRWEKQQTKRAAQAAAVLQRMQSDVSKGKPFENQSPDAAEQEGSSSNLVTPRAQRPSFPTPSALTVPSGSTVSASSQTPDAPSPRSSPSAHNEMMAAYSPTNPPLPAVNAVERPAFHSYPLNLFTNILIGILAGCVTQLVVNPLSVVQTRIMTQKKSSAVGDQLGIFGTAKKIIEDEGFSVLFTGLVPAFILTTNPAIQFLVFDRLKALALAFLHSSKARSSSSPSINLTDKSSSSSSSLLSSASSSSSSSSSSVSALVLPGPFSLVIGAIAKLTATVVTYPYIMAKVRLQWKGSGDQAEIKYSGALDVIASIVKQDGFLALYTGFGAQLFKSVLATSLLFFGKEKSMYYIALLIQRIQQSNGKMSSDQTQTDKEKRD